MVDLPAPWQHGYTIEFLKELAAPFKHALSPHCHGAFGVPKEREVAEALVANEFVGDAKAAALVSRMKVAGRQHDFTGRDVVIPAGDIVISKLGYSPGHEAAIQPLVAKILSEHVPAASSGFFAAPAHAVWLQIYEEDPVSVSVARQCGFKYIAGKVTAGGDIIGLYAAMAERAPIAYQPEELACLGVIMPDYLSAGHAATMLKELQAADEFWADHYSSYNKGKTWTAMALQGYDPADPTFIIKPAEMSKKWKSENPQRMTAVAAPTVIVDRFPLTMTIVDAIPGKKDRVRFMRLAPGGGELTRHADITDREAGVADGKIARIHLPLKTHSDVQFSSWGMRGNRATLTMPQLAMCYLDQRKPHAARNGSDTERIHLVIDVYSTPELRRHIAAAVAAGTICT